jgi:hypothetical protein
MADKSLGSRATYAVTSDRPSYTGGGKRNNMQEGKGGGVRLQGLRLG